MADKLQKLFKPSLLYRMYSTSPRCFAAYGDMTKKPSDITAGMQIPHDYTGYEEFKTETAGETFKKGADGILDYLKRVVYRFQEYDCYGMYRDDLLRDGLPEVAEAVRRLPEHLYLGRIHRQHRMIQLSRGKIELPQEMWTRFDDPMHDYLQPYLKEVEAEIAEKKAWESR